MLNRKTRRKNGIALLGGLFGLATVHSALSVPLSQQPLFLRTGADPNIMFILDDSGSMQFEVTPSAGVNYFNNLDRVAYVYPNGVCPYAKNRNSGCDYWQGGDQAVPQFGRNNKWAAYYRSSQNNKTYYNPAQRYDPWAGEDGTSWPMADPKKAYHNPANPTRGVRNLTIDNSQSARCWLRNQASKNSSRRNACYGARLSFFPATYFHYSGSGSVFNPANYTRIEIKPGRTYPGGTRRSDCAKPAACTYQEEIQNFANWYSYYRSRGLLARAGVGRAFASQGSELRVGFGTLNTGSRQVDGKRTSTIISGVRTFSDQDREDFFDNLYESDIPNAGTPLLAALRSAGNYYSREDSRGPWATRPGTNAAGAQVACRASYTILMTDGYGSDYSSVSGFGNADGDNGAPFNDARSNTLADIAMEYWENDLHTRLDNKVETKKDPATWQHMVTFGVGLGVTGSVDPEGAFAAIESKTPIAWPNPRDGSNSAKLDDLLHASVNSHGGFYSASDATTFSQQLSKVLSEIGSRQGSASSVAANSTRLGTDTAIFQALFNSNDWSGEVRAIRLKEDGTLANTFLWSTSDSGKIPATGRKILTYTDSGTVEFLWDNLTTAQQTALIGSDDEQTGKDRLDWVRGETIDGLRTRSTLLGDVVNASPALAGDREFYYAALPSRLGGDTYATYHADKKKERTQVLYASANDGMLHGFNAETGKEVVAYVPTGAYPKFTKLAAIDYGTPDNQHQYLVDGPLYISDAYFNSKWANVLVGTYGAGAKGLFVLDVTNPSSPRVLFELDGTHPDIGNIVGKPLIAPTLDGWKLIFGNGYNSGNDRAALVIVDLANPNDIRVLPTNGSVQNGMTTPSLLINSSGIVKAAYAGDLLGNMWKFDLGGAVTDWGSAFGNSPLFTARDPNGRVQPITAAATLGPNPAVQGALMVYFGTGSYLTQSDNAAGSVVNSFYGIVDKNEPITKTDRSSLMEKTIVERGNSRTITGDAETSWWENKSGWFLDFNLTPSDITGERVISKPLLIYDRLIFPTLITSEDPCTFGASGWTMELIAFGDKRYTSETILGESGNKKDESAVISFSDVIIDGKDIFLPKVNTSGEPNLTDGRLFDGKNRMSWKRIR
ncbi:pilus assembly protein [Microbulbifer spongiae]|uniref:PilC/PilY family type IV pilus protein n=1 Tax=Microbulbifer spongiae TaxID=2944933 RepID=A0ABY9E8D8_9GAMM|nr:PilC/PilY family type IV pilus protein [Microbulbifer sp. MI-G]WKD49314.1 PilC/PilY family type IV pilus protein [Microbulbifer sp. MI-G]